MDIHFGQLFNLGLLWLVAAVVVVFIAASVARRRAWARFVNHEAAGRMAKAGTAARRLLKSTLAALALVAMVLALIDVRWGKAWHEVPQKGIEVMFALDVSRSMLAEDVAPNRLDRAKGQISDMVDAMPGDHVGLVAFAGDARQVIPLTSHHHDFKRELAEVDTHDVDLGGSRLGDALETAAAGFLTKTGDHKAIVVFTDGEDQESQPARVAKQLHDEQGIRVFTVGLGDIDQGARVPVGQAGRGRHYLEYQGQQVWSKLNGTVLQDVASASDGAYIPAGTKVVDMADVYHRFVSQVEEQDFEIAKINQYVPRYSWFVALALLLVVAEALLPATPRTQRRHVWTRRMSRLPKSLWRWLSSHTSRLGKPTSAAAVIVVALLSGASANAASPNELARRGNEALQSGNVEQALTDYQQAVEQLPDSAPLKYNQAIAHYRQGNFEEAQQLLTDTIASGDRALDAKARFNLGNCDYAQAVEVASQDKAAATERLRAAITNYQGALRADPTDDDARANIELAQRLIDQLQEEQEKQQKDQQKQDQQKEDQDQQPSSSADQDQADQDQQSQPQDGQQPDEKPQQSQPDDQPGQQGEPQDQQQGESDESGEQDDQATPSPEKPSAGEDTKPAQAADGQSAAGGPPSDQTPSEEQAGSAEFDNGVMTHEEAQKMLQAVRDRELMRRMEQLQHAKSRRQNVDRDW